MWGGLAVSHGRLAITAILTIDRSGIALLHRAAAWKIVAAREETNE
jgi:hypothetical protein